MIKAVNLSKTYHQGKSCIGAIKDAHLEIARKESVLITGPSGAGKSTLLHIMGGLDKPTGGCLFFDGADFYTLPERARSMIRNKKIGFVFQFYHLLPEFTVLENVMLPALIGRKKIFCNSSDIRKRAERLLDMVSLRARMTHRPSELSGGESQRAAIARALINFPEILLCDEPTGNLDSRIGKEIIACIRMLKAEEGMAIVIVTHDERIGEDFDRRYRITDGTLGELIHGPQGLPEWQVCRQE